MHFQMTVLFFFPLLKFPITNVFVLANGYSVYINLVKFKTVKDNGVFCEFFFFFFFFAFLLFSTETMVAVTSTPYS